MIAILIVFAFIVLVALYKSPVRVNHNIRRLQKRIQPYSGVDKEGFIRYVNLLQLMELSLSHDIDIAAGFFYTAVGCLDNIHVELLTKHINISDLIKEIQAEGENILLNQASNSKQFFIPRYTNELEYNHTIGESY